MLLAFKLFNYLGSGALKVFVLFSSAFTNVAESSGCVNPFAKLFLNNLVTLDFISVTDFIDFPNLV